MAFSAASPWYDTKLRGKYLDVLNIRTVPAADSDPLYTIEEQYTHRPDLLAHDLYNDHRLFWVFAQRNPDVLKDPIYDFVPGTQIYLPQEKYLREELGN